MLTRKGVEVVCYGVPVTIKGTWTCAIPVMAIAAKLPAFDCEDSALKLRITDEAFMEVYEVFEDDFFACAVLAYVEGVAEY